MKKLLLPLIVLLLIIGYFMSRGGDKEAKDAYDSLDKPDTEMQQDQDGGTTPDGTEPPPDGMDTAPDSDRPEQPESAPPGGDTSSDDTSGDMMNRVEDAASDVGDAAGDAAGEAGKALEDAGEATRKAAEDAVDTMDKKLKELEGEDSGSSDTSEEPQS